MLNEIAKCHTWVTWKSLPLTGTLILKWRWYWNRPKTGWWFQRFYIFTRDMIQFHEHIFQMGWFNHQLERTSRNIYNLGVGFKSFLFSTLFGEDFQFDEHIFQMGWFNHQLERTSRNIYNLGVGFKSFLFSTLFGEDFQFDEHIFQMGWFNHQPYQNHPRSIIFWMANSPWEHVTKLYGSIPKLPNILNVVQYLPSIYLSNYLTTMGTQNLHFLGVTTHILRV